MSSDPALSYLEAGSKLPSGDAETYIQMLPEVPGGDPAAPGVLSRDAERDS